MHIKRLNEIQMMLINYMYKAIVQSNYIQISRSISRLRYVGVLLSACTGLDVGCSLPSPRSLGRLPPCDTKQETHLISSHDT